MKDLIERLEAAEEGSRELDAEIFMAVCGPSNTTLEARIYADTQPYYTASLDAALTLVPDGCGWTIYGNITNSKAVAHVWAPDTLLQTVPYPASAATPELALSSAAIKARLALEKEGKNERPD